MEILSQKVFYLDLFNWCMICIYHLFEMYLQHNPILTLIHIILYIQSVHYDEIQVDCTLNIYLIVYTKLETILIKLKQMIQIIQFIIIFSVLLS